MASRREYEMLFSLNAQLGGNFSGTFSKAQQQLLSMQKDIQALNKTQSDVSAYQKQQQAVEGTQKKLEVLQQQYDNIQKEIQETGGFSADLENKLLSKQQQIDKTYDDFVGRVAAGRNLTTEAVDEIAQGRVWAGGDAIKIGLVDELGGLTDAIRYAAAAAGLENYRLVEYPAVLPLYEQMLSSMNEQGTEQDVKSDVAGLTDRTARWLLGLRGPEIAARMETIELKLK